MREEWVAENLWWLFGLAVRKEEGKEGGGGQ